MGGEPGSATRRAPSSRDDKAPVKPRSPRVPEFTLPEVVITGENQLTIGAKRLDRYTQDVTTGTRDPGGLDRPTNDLPGLEKGLTALSSPLNEPPRRTAFILHPGAGTSRSMGVWALFGQEYGELRYLLSGDYSGGQGETVGEGRIHERRHGYSLGLVFAPTRKIDFRLTRDYSVRREDLPYQATVLERRGTAFTTGADWRFREGWSASFSAAARDLPYELGTGTPWNGPRLREPEAAVRVSADLRNPILEGLDLEGGMRRSLCSPCGEVSRSDLFRGSATLRWRAGNRVEAKAGTGISRVTGFEQTLRPNLRGELRILLGDSTRVGLTARREKETPGLYDRFLGTPYALPSAGIRPPAEVQQEFGAEISRKFGGRWLLTCGHSTGRWSRLSQWTDAGGGSVPVHLRVLETLERADLQRTSTGLETDLGAGWTLDARHRLSRARSIRGPARLTDLPLHEGSLAIARKTDRWEADLLLGVRSPMNSDGNLPGTYGSHLRADLSARHRWNERVSFWAEGRNLMGRRYETSPGYPAPRHHVMVGMELIL
jgi:hypothetical protein